MEKFKHIASHTLSHQIDNSPSIQRNYTIWKLDTNTLNQSLFHFSLKSKAVVVATKPSYYFYTAGPGTYSI